MDVEVISAGLLRDVLEGGAISMYEIRDRIRIGTAHLLLSYELASGDYLVDLYKHFNT